MAGPVGALITGAEMGQRLSGMLPSPIGRMGEYGHNLLAPIRIPEAGELLDAVARSWISEKNAAPALALHGIALFPDAGLTVPGLRGKVSECASMWQAMLRSRQAVPGLIDAYRLVNRLSMSVPYADLLLQRHGFQEQHHRDLMLSLRYEVPGPSDLVRFAIRHVFEPDLLGRYDFNAERNPILDFYHQTAGINYPIFNGPLKETISRLYDDDADIRRSIGETARRLQIPPPGSGAEVPGWLAGLYRRYNLPNPTWANAYWWAHWVWPSPTQGYEMVFRFRPDRRRDDEPEDTRGLDFTRQDLNLLLRGNDYPPHFRPFLAGIARRLPGIRFMTRAIASGVFDAPRIIELFEKQGYGRPDAEAMSESLFYADRVSRGRLLLGRTKGQVLDAYRTGTISRDDAAVALYRLGLSDPRRMAALDLLPVARQLDLAFARAAVVTVRGAALDGGPDVALRSLLDLRAELAGVDADWQSRLVKRAITAARKCYLAGRRDAPGTRGELTRLAVDRDRIDQYMQLWTLERDCGSRELTTAQIQESARHGILSREAAEARLVNLGWPITTAQILLTEVGRDIALDTARAAQARARTLSQQQRAAEQLVRAAQGALTRARAELSRHGSPAQLKTWITRSLIGTAEVHRRLAALGWPLVDAQRLVDQALQDQAERRAKLLKRQQSQQAQQGNGETGVP